MMDKKYVKVLIIVFTTLFLTAAVIFTLFYVTKRPVSKTSTPITVEIAEGTSTRAVFEKLSDLKAIKNDSVTLFYSNLFHKSNFKAGKFEIDSSWDLNFIIDYLSNSSNIIQNTFDFTILPGTNIRNIAKKLAEHIDYSEDEIIDQWNNTDFLEAMMRTYVFLTSDIFDSKIVYKLEGYFFPDTYNLFENSTIEDVTKVFLNNTKKYFETYYDYFFHTDLTIHQVFTLASIIDYEGNSFDDRKDISSVFFNRMAAEMPLQSSVTRCYAIALAENKDVVNGNECEIELDYFSPYDTYQVSGLPPGPIRCVSETSLIAALKPNTTDYYYFAGDVCGDGAVYFAKDLNEHQKNIDEIYAKCDEDKEKSE